MKLIDVYTKGNVVDFLFGEDNLKDWYGDDWEDTPWEHNAGVVYDKFVCAKITGVFNTDLEIAEPKDIIGYCGNSPYKRDDFKTNNLPILTIGNSFIGYTAMVNNRKCLKFYMEDTLANVVVKILKYGYIIPNESKSIIQEKI